MSSFLYHGCVALKSTGADGCSLTYTISNNQAPMDDVRRATEHDRISGRFLGAAEAMKRAAEEGLAA